MQLSPEELDRLHQERYALPDGWYYVQFDTHPDAPAGPDEWVLMYRMNRVWGAGTPRTAVYPWRHPNRIDQLGWQDTYITAVRPYDEHE